MQREIKNLVNKTIDKNWLVKINNQIYLKKYQMEILDFYQIDYKKCGSISELLFLIEDILNDDFTYDKELLEEVVISLQEFQYYYATNK